MSLPVTVVVFDLGKIFHFLLGNASVNTRYRGVVAWALFLSAPSAPKTSLLVVLVLFRVCRESLLSGRGPFSTRRVSKGGVGGLILSTRILLLLLSRFVFSETS